MSCSSLQYLLKFIVIFAVAHCSDIPMAINIDDHHQVCQLTSLACVSSFGFGYANGQYIIVISASSQNDRNQTLASADSIDKKNDRWLIPTTVHKIWL